VLQNRKLIAALGPKHVLVLAGDHVYSMDYTAMLERHVSAAADATVACIEVPIGEARAFGIVEADRDLRLRSFTEKPYHARPMPGRCGVALASMGIYVFQTDFLLACLDADEGDPNSHHDFGYNVLPRIAAQANVYVHVFGENRYWRDVGSIDSYWQAHMDLLDSPPQLVLNEPHWPLWGSPRSGEPGNLAPEANVVASLIGSGSTVEGDVYRSVVSNGCRIGQGSSIEESVVLPNASVGRDCLLERVIVGAHCHVPDGTLIEAPIDFDYRVSANGIQLALDPRQRTARSGGVGHRTRHACSEPDMWARARVRVQPQTRSLPGPEQG
jgi:glucose-1-phosphate adenylyltransferase